MSYKLHANVDGNFRTIKVAATAEFAKFDLETVNVNANSKLSPMGRAPALETPCGMLIFESNAIARFIARARADSGLYGATFGESGLVDSWVDFSAHELEVPASIVVYPFVNNASFPEAAVSKANDDLNKALTVLNNHLLNNTYLVGHKVTLADIAVASALLYPFKFTMGPSAQKRFGNVTRWFTTVVNQAAFKAVAGETVLASSDSAKKEGAAEKKEKAPKAPKEEKPKAPKEEKPKAEKKKKDEDEDEPEPDVPVEKKADHPFKIMDKEKPTTFVMDAWKKTYSNTEDYRAAMNTFWETFDPAGWSIFRGDYKYDEEHRMLFMTSNLIAGFIQRTEEIRKWLFGTMSIRGENAPGKMKVSCYYLIRGDSIEPLLKCNDDAECYNWTKMEIPASEADKETLYMHWCSDIGATLDGEACLDIRCYK